MPARLVQQVIEEGPAADVEDRLGGVAGQHRGGAEAADEEDGLLDLHAAAQAFMPASAPGAAAFPPAAGPPGPNLLAG